MNDLALSTSWNAFRHDSGRKICDEILSLGIKKLELSFNLTNSVIDEINSFRKNSDIEIVSVHNFCPRPDGLEGKVALPDCFSLASLDSDQRKEAVRLTKKSIDTAKKLGAKTVVIHGGRVEIKDRTNELISIFENEGIDSPDYSSLKEELIKERKSLVGPHLDQVLKSFDSLSEHAIEQNILLGIENRYYFREIPTYDEFKIILDKFDGKNIQYWHDVGHGQLWENLGFDEHENYLKDYGNKLIGVHLHDIEDADDHRAPLKGNFNFEMLSPYINTNVTKVIEAHHPATAKDIANAVKYLSKIFNK